MAGKKEKGGTHPEGLGLHEGPGREGGQELDPHAKLIVPGEVGQLAVAILAGGGDHGCPGGPELVSLDLRGLHPEFLLAHGDEATATSAAPVLRAVGRELHEVAREGTDDLAGLLVDAAVARDLAGVVVGDASLDGAWPQGDAALAEVARDELDEGDNLEGLQPDHVAQHSIGGAALDDGHLLDTEGLGLGDDAGRDGLHPRRVAHEGAEVDRLEGGDRPALAGGVHDGRCVHDGMRAREGHVEDAGLLPAVGYGLARSAAGTPRRFGPQRQDLRAEVAEGLVVAGGAVRDGLSLGYRHVREHGEELGLLVRADEEGLGYAHDRLGVYAEGTMDHAAAAART